MKNKFLLLLSSLVLCIFLAGCGEDPQITQFKNDIDSFCNEIAVIDTNINSIDAQSENAKYELLGYLDQLNQSFQSLAEISVPDEYAYIKGLAEEASSYMTTAVESYHEAFGENSYNEYTAEYARENYERAYKRITVIIKLLHGEDISDLGATIEESE
mgnify:CR=1 FL=1